MFAKIKIVTPDIVHRLSQSIIQKDYRIKHGVYMSYNPEDLIPDDKNHLESNGRAIRKGTMAAALANADIVDSSTSTPEQKQEALMALKKLAPTMKAFGFTKHLMWKNSEIQALFNYDD